MVDRILNKEGGAPEGLMIFTGNANPKLASDVARHLGTRLAGPQSPNSVTANPLSKFLSMCVASMPLSCNPLVRLPMTI